MKKRGGVERRLPFFVRILLIEDCCGWVVLDLRRGQRRNASLPEMMTA